jgi:thiosulfate/3-mercaptopyruvate sulfurtransferase
LTELGISANKHIIIYDDKNGSNAAARFWWMLKSVGHEKVQVLNGGLQMAIKKHVSMNSNYELLDLKKPTTLKKLDTAKKESLLKLDPDNQEKIEPAYQRIKETISVKAEKKKKEDDDEIEHKRGEGHY